MLSEQDRANLTWARICNRDGLGLFVYTVRRFGHIPEMTPLIEAGLCEMRKGSGYWITPAGRRALKDKADD